ncbi:DUF485 domain-containing protein [Sphingomonas turrisvirgatae]|uniref:DUF485 domain-containing protein n=1 Tax=Sphingomonas turrisvirgatae TaxID=1888892 RepID=A0A1E3LRP3_9SPHN|nr:DUF485 domain-containing protein [Sphingomonas turrisvirgatae]ODP36431.1 hypothetical protein BFL28_05370 [Sphingomonas turrisvirgatae]
MTEQETLDRVARDPRYQALVAERSRFAWILSWIVVGLFMAFILTIALDKAALAAPIGDRVATWGIPAGIGLILLAILSIALFTRRANRRWDPAMAEIMADAAGRERQ